MTDASRSTGGGKTRWRPSFFCLTHCFKPDKNEESEEAHTEIKSFKLSEQAKEKVFEERKKTQPRANAQKPLLGAEAPNQQGEMGTLAKRSSAPLGAPVGTVKLPMQQGEMGTLVKRSAPPLGAPVGAVPTPGPATSSSSRVVFLGSVSRVYLEELMKSPAEVLGKGAFGTTYKVWPKTGPVVAVKRLRNVISERAFREKVAELGEMQSAYLVPMQTYYYSKDEKLLVYEFVSLGSLYTLLHGSEGNKVSSSTPLGFEERVNIALWAARGIEYIHSAGPTASHGNIKSSNVLLSGSNMAHISEQGLIQVATPKALPSPGSGYRAPEATNIRKISQKADVYSFGVLLMEMLTGKEPSSILRNEGDKVVGLPWWIRSKSRDEWTTEVFDLELVKNQTAKQEMVQLLQLAIDCTTRYPDERPTMAEVARRIDEILQLFSDHS